MAVTAAMTDLMAAIDTLLAPNNLPTPYILNRYADDAAYEAYIFTLILRAIREAGGEVNLRSRGNPNRNPPTFIFRGSHGSIYSSRDDFGYAVCSYNGISFEVHIDVLHQGTSKVPHEIDVSLIESNEARQSRTAGRDPKAKGVFGTFECKFYSKTLDTALIRTFVGLLDDLGKLKITPRFVTNTSSRVIGQYCTGKEARPRFNGRLTPLDYTAERRFIDALIDDIQKWLGLS